MNLLSISITVFALIYSNLATPLQNGCKDTPLDVIAVMDGSESITDEKFTQMKMSLEQLIRSLRLQYHDSRFGVVVYSSSVSATIPFTNNEIDLIGRIRAMDQPMEGTQTHLGLEEMNNMFRMEGRPHAVKVGIVFTDGISKNKIATANAAKDSTRLEVNMFSVGTSMNIDMEELQAIASANDRVLSLARISEIYDHLKGLVRRCEDGFVQTGTTGGLNSNNNGQWTGGQPNSNNNGQWTTRGPNSNNNGQWTTKGPNANNNGQWTTRGPNSNNNGQWTGGQPNSNNNGQWTTGQPNNNNGGNGGSWATIRPSGPIVDPSIIDPQGLCDNCTLRNGVGFNSVTGSCQKFIQCIFNLDMLISTIVKDCPAGLFWDQDKLTCNYPSEVNCIEDPCYSQPNGDMAHPSNCREYYTCFDSVSFEKCCLPGYAFNAANSKCEPNSACVDTCKWGNPEEGCTRRAIAEKRSYEQAVGENWIVMSCPLGALYSQQDCRCSIYDEDYVNTPPPPVARDAECKPAVQLSFNSGTYDESGNYNYVQNNGVVVENGAAYFDGKSFLRIPRFANVDFRKTVTIKLKYKLDGAATGQEALVTNGDCGEKQSIFIVAESSQTILGLISGNSTDKKTATLDSSSDWNEVEYKVVDGELTSAVNGRQVNTMVDGLIKRKHCSLQIGRGDGFENFKGWIDELSVYLCAA